MDVFANAFKNVFKKTPKQHIFIFIYYIRFLTCFLLQMLPLESVLFLLDTVISMLHTLSHVVSWWKSLVCCSHTYTHFTPPDFESCQQSKTVLSFSTLDSSSSETRWIFKPETLTLPPHFEFLWGTPRLSPELRLTTFTLWPQACVMDMCAPTFLWSCPAPSPTFPYHPPRAILSVWKFGFHSWNPEKHCHLLIVIIALACSVQEKKREKPLQYKRITSLW